MVNIKLSNAFIKGMKSILDFTESLPGKNLLKDLKFKVRRKILIPGTTRFPMMVYIKSFVANAIIIPAATPTTLLSFINFLNSS
jgi:hypothetical protein